jgi:hypothetical protein
MMATISTFIFQATAILIKTNILWKRYYIPLFFYMI